MHSPSQKSVELGNAQLSGKPKEQRRAQPGVPHRGTSSSRYASATGAIQIGLQEQEEYEEMGYPQEGIYEETDYL